VARRQWRRDKEVIPSDKKERKEEDEEKEEEDSRQPQLKS